MGKLAAAILLVLTLSPQTYADVCYAYTWCQKGYVISCSLEGVPGVSCNAWVQPYQWVTCEGFDHWGVWQRLTSVCWWQAQ